MTQASQNGFTLLEIIGTLLVAGVVAAILVVFMGTAVKQSGDPLHQARDEASVERIMESIIADYVRSININATTTGVLATLQSTINSGAYGEGASAEWISLSSGTESSGSSSDNTLKVTVEGTYHSLTTILARARADGDDSLVMY